MNTSHIVMMLMLMLIVMEMVMLMVMLMLIGDADADADGADDADADADAFADCDGDGDCERAETIMTIAKNSVAAAFLVHFEAFNKHGSCQDWTCPMVGFNRKSVCAALFRTLPDILPTHFVQPVTTICQIAIQIWRC